MAKKDISKLTRKLRAKELEIKILKDLEGIVQQAANQEDFLESIKDLLFKIFRLDFCFFVLKEGKKFSVKSLDYPFEFEEELFIEIAHDAIKSKYPLTISNTKRHLRIKNHKIKSLIAAGIKTEDFEGAVILGGKRKRNFLKLDAWKMMVLTQGLANSLNKIRIKEELMDKNKELEIISKIDYLRDTITDRDKLVTAILKEIKKEIECELCFFYLKDEKSKLLIVGKSNESNFVKINKASFIQLAEEAIDESKLKKFKDVNKDITAALCTPLMISEGFPGAIGIINAKINEENVKIVQTIAKQVNYAIVEDWEKKQIKNTFGKFVSPEIIETMLKNKEQDFLKTKKEEITVLFSDIRNFTQLAEKASSERILEILNDHFNTLTEIILRNKGMVDKFIGDAIMAVWGVPVYQESQAFRAIKAALEMQKAQKKLERKYAKEGLSFRIGIGINTGEAIVGNVGSELKMNYTVIGDMVNVASRICSAAKPGQVLISENTYRESRKSVRTLRLKPIEAKNKSYPVQVYEVVELKKEGVYDE